MDGKEYIDGLDNSDYHSNIAVSKSTLDLASRDLFYPMWSRECPQDQEKIKTFDFGDAMHAICLEPDRLKTEFVVMPKFGQKNADKEAKKEWLEEHSKFKVLTEDDFKKLNLMFESVMSYKPSRDLIESEGVAERSYFWKDEVTGLDCKCRPDKYIESKRLLVDVKTTPDLKKFCYSVDDFRYYVQDPWYCDGVARFDGPVRMEFLVIQKTIEIGRYPVQVVKLPDLAVEYGRSIYRQDLNRYGEFLSSEVHPGTPELPMHYRFIEDAMNTTTEVQI